MLKVEWQVSREQFGAIDSPQLLYLLIRVSAPDDFMIARMPLNVCLVIDRSTSMRGERLEEVKRAAALVVEKLATDDVISLVTFSDRAEVVLPASRVLQKTPVFARIRSILASGGTEIYQGLNAGIREMNKASLPDHLNHLILLTDGHTYGDVENCLKLARAAAARNIGISAFGIGAEWNDLFLDQLVSPSGGQSAFIESASQIVEHLQRRIHNLGAVYANSVRMSLRNWAAGVKLAYGLKLRPYAQPLVDEAGELRLGAVEGRAPLLFLLEVTVEPQSAGTTLALPLTFNADIPSEQVTGQVAHHTLTFPVVAQETELKPQPAIIEAARVLSLYRMNERAWQDVELGELEIATTRMRRLTTRLLESGFNALAVQARQEAERLTTVGTLSEDGRKKLKYGTRALFAEAITVIKS